MKNIQNLTIDINKKPFQTITANTGEVASRFIRITILENNIPVDLTGVTAYLYAKKADGTKVFNSVKVEYAKQGIVLAELTSQVLAIAGLVKLTLLLTKDGAKLASKQIIVTVDESVIDEEAIESSNEFNALAKGLADLAEYDTYKNNVLKHDENLIKHENKLNEVSSQLEHKANVVDVNAKVWSMANMGQDVKEAMTGGSVAIVGVNSVLESNIVNKQVTPQKTSFADKINLFNKATRLEGVAATYPDDVLISNESFNTSDFIEVETSQYTLNIANYDTVFMYNEAKELIDKISLEGWGIKTNTIYITDNIKFVRLSYLKDYEDEIMFVKGNNLPNVYCNFEDVIIKNLKQNAFDTVNDGLKGVYIFTGDSICYGAGSTGGYSSLIAERNKDMIYYNYGVSGTTIAKRDGRTDSILERFDIMNNTADFVILEGGVNDKWTGVPIGDFNKNNMFAELDEYTFTGALESLFKKCLTKYDNAKIFYVIPHTIDIVNGMNDFMDRAEEVCKKWNVILIDLRKLSGMNVYIDSVKTNFTQNGDGVHPNEEGYKQYYIKPIINILKIYNN